MVWVSIGVACRAVPDTKDSLVIGHDSGLDDSGEPVDSGGEESDTGLELERVAAAKRFGESEDDYAGYAVAGGCDINGDGLDDIVIGAPHYVEKTYAGGAVYTQFGPVSGEASLATADARRRGNEFLGEASHGETAGAAVACVGDTNGDGLGDVLIGAPNRGDNPDLEGGVYLELGPLSGAEDSLEASDAILEGEVVETGYSYSSTGHSVAAAGDVNGDGLMDILVGAPWLGNSIGAAYLLYGPVLGTVSLEDTEVRIRPTGLGGKLGEQVAGAGDLNADGFDDILIEQPFNEDAVVLVFLGPVPGGVEPEDADTYLMPPEGADPYTDRYFETETGDADGDGYGDWAVSDVLDDDGGDNAGAVYVFSGANAGAVEFSDALAKLVGPGGSVGAGRSLAAAGDVNADGFADLAIGVPSGAGTFHVVFGPMSGTSSLSEAGVTLHGGGDDAAGCALAGAGDVDGDGLDDLLIGGDQDDDGGENAGAAWLVLGASMR